MNSSRKWSGTLRAPQLGGSCGSRTCRVFFSQGKDTLHGSLWSCRNVRSSRFSSLHKESNKLISNLAYTFSRLITMINHGENNYVTLTLTSMMKLLRCVIKIHCVCVCVRARVLALRC